MQANQTPVIWTMVICSIVLLIAGFIAVSSIKNNMPDTSEVPSADEIASVKSI